MREVVPGHEKIYADYTQQDYKYINETQHSEPLGDEKVCDDCDRGRGLPTASMDPDCRDATGYKPCDAKANRKAQSAACICGPPNFLSGPLSGIHAWMSLPVREKKNNP